MGVLSLVRLVSREQYVPLPHDWLRGDAGGALPHAVPGEPALPRKAFSPMAASSGIVRTLQASESSGRDAIMEGPLEDVLRGAAFHRGVVPLLQASGLLTALRVLKPAATTRDQRRSALGMTVDPAAKEPSRSGAAKHTPQASMTAATRAGFAEVHAVGQGRPHAAPSPLPAQALPPAAGAVRKTSDGGEGGWMHDETMVAGAEPLDADAAVVAGLDLDDELLAALMTDELGGPMSPLPVPVQSPRHDPSMPVPPPPPPPLRAGLAMRLAAGKLRIGGGASAAAAR